MGSMDGQIIPIGTLMRQLVLALGAALAVGNLAVVIRERRRRSEAGRRRPNMKIVALNIAIGTVLALWGAGSLLAAA